MARKKKKKHSSGLYRKSVTVGRKPDGTPIRQYVYGETQSECEDKIAQIRIDKKMGVVVTDKRSTWGYWAGVWKAIKYKQIGKSTQDMYNSALNHLAPLDGRTASELTSVDLLMIVSEMEAAGYAKRTIKAVIQTAAQICALARKNRAMMIDITEDIKAPKDAPEKKRTALDKSVQDAIWNVKPLPSDNDTDTYRAKRLPLARMLALMTLCCGLRRGETVALSWADVDLKNRCISVSHSYDFKAGKGKDPKTAAGIRKVPVPNRFLLELTEWKKSCPPSLLVFPGGAGHISESEHSNLWDTLLDAINGITVSQRISAGRTKKKPVAIITRKIEFTSHDLRHTFATNSVAKGVDIKTLQYIIGHAKAETLLDIYAHFSQEAWDAAALILDGKLGSGDETAKKVETG
ncbi:MAG: site-specific integrase [Oscillospiraceae bacterium]|nr:site-specific integrase [Oscillospiraceae bacterium]